MATAKVKSVWYCTSCGNESPKWMGRCPACGEWNTMVEEPKESRKASSGQAGRSSLTERRRPVHIRDIETSGESRISLGSGEVDRILGGGIVPGSRVLIGGEPGIGKSTLSLQIPLHCDSIRTLYVTGEESVEKEVDDYIVFFNEQRPAYSLNYLTPKQFREQFATYHNC